MNLSQLRKHKKKLEEIARKYRAWNLRVFGSVARGNSGKKSDVDILVRLKPSASLLYLSAMQIAFSELLKTKVDVVPDNAINKRFADIVISEALPI